MSSTEPTEEQLANLRSASPDGPITMINLLKFRVAARYDHETPDDGEPVSGQAAYQCYAEVAKRKIEDNGGRIVFLAPSQQLFVGDVGTDDWDMVAIIDYPTRAAYLKGFDSDEYQQAIKHRVAGLERRLLLQCTQNMIARSL